MKKHCCFLFAVLFFCAGSLAAPMSFKAFTQRPKLVLVIVIDQFRSDYLTRFEKRFLPAGPEIGGFRYLMEKGAYFPFAEHDVLQNMTCPGHAAILTGALPYGTHISLNDWYDTSKQLSVYCVDDDQYPVVGVAGKPGQHGISPSQLKTTTVGDELKAAGYSSHVVTVSLKDRAAVMLGGHRADLAMWLDTDTFRWVSSRFYISDGKLPEWMEKLNDKVKSRIDQKVKWQAKFAPTGLSKTNEPFKYEMKYASADALRSPIGGDLTTEAALEAARAYHMGSGQAPDLLAVSYSSHDFLGHKVGPNAREMEEMTIEEDRNLAELFRGIDRTVPGGLKNVLIVLTADHGMSHDQAQAKKAGFDTGSIHQHDVMKRINEKLIAKFGKPENGDWILAVEEMNFYLNHDGIAKKKIQQSDVEREVKSLLLKEPFAETVFTLSDYRSGELPTGMYRRQIQNSYLADRNGDVVLIPKPFFLEGSEPATHMTGYVYDRVVPLILKGPHLKAGVYSAPVRVVDLAPTLSFLLGVIPPTHNEGRVLSDAIGD